MSVIAQFKAPGEEGGRGGYGGAGVAVPPAKIGLWMFMLVVTMLFLLFGMAYLMRSAFGDWRQMPVPGQLYANTLALLASGAALEWARAALRRANRDSVRTALVSAGALAVAFLIGQLLAWGQLNESGYLLASNPSNSFFFLLTGLHGLHLAGGLVAWSRVAARLKRGASLGEIKLALDLTARYWHFMLLIWLALFALLASPPETIAALAAICGLR